MCMKNDLSSSKLDKLVEGRLKKLSGLRLKEELDFMENVSLMSGRDGDEFSVE